jgi:hypothetical protein
MTPAGEGAIGDLLNPSISGAVAEQNVRPIAAEVVPDAYDGIGGVGTSNLMPFRVRRRSRSPDAASIGGMISVTCIRKLRLRHGYGESGEASDHLGAAGKKSSRDLEG